MNYEKLYFAFIEKHQNQKFDEVTYTEVHHIIPRHAGGDDSKENLIRLDYKQHTFAHHLLWKIYKRVGDYYAWLLMSGQEPNKKLANLKAIGKANVESGHLEKIREFSNTSERQRKLKELNEYKVNSGLALIYVAMANEAWRGSNHTEEWKEQKASEMKIWSKDNPEHYLKMSVAGAKAQKETSEQLSNQVIINAERNEEFLQEISSRSKNKFISPEGLEFDSPIFAAKYYGNVEYFVIENWCKRSQHGWSRKPKAA